ncbi:MAG TPA: hypothetical protein VK652_16545 [Steroidobacteraceae bacterium]|nr:hypothetical protein [Steroidobacteraceae bacterium]
MQPFPVRKVDAAAIPDRRKRRGRRASDHSGDLDGAYNDDTKPSPLSFPTAIRIYGPLVWIVMTSAIGTLFLIKEAWGYVAGLLGHN